MFRGIRARNDESRVRLGGRIGGDKCRGFQVRIEFPKRLLAGYLGNEHNGSLVSGEGIGCLRDRRQ